MPILIRWAIRADHYAILEIERQSFGPHALCLGAIRDVCDEHRMFVYVATTGWPTPAAEQEYVVAWLACEIQMEGVHIHRLAVHPEFRRRGIGRALLERVTKKLRGRRTEATVFVDEDRLAPQLFFKACGWRCRQLWPPLVAECDGVGMLEFVCESGPSGAEVIDEIMHGEARVLQ